MRASIALLTVLTATLVTGCSQTSSDAIASKPKSESAQALMVRLAKNMQSCWFKKRDPTFRQYKLANEVNSLAGKPRVLIVPKNKPTSLPKLVVQAERVGGRNVVTTFGPIMQTKDGRRLQSTINRWERGSTACA